MKQAKNPVRGVETTIEIIEKLKEVDGAGLTELTSHLDLTKGAVHNHLSTLEQHKLIVREGNTYKLGLQFTVLGEYVRNHNLLYEIGKPETDELAQETGEYAHLTTEQHGLGMKLYKSQGEKAVGSQYQITKLQKSEPLHYNATGKAILAYLPSKRVDQIVDHYGLPRRTSNTITSRGELFDDLAEIRERGYSYNDEEEIEGYRAVGAPIMDREGTVLGSISVSGPTSRIKGDQFRETLPEMVTRTANIIEVNLNMTDRSTHHTDFD